MAYDIYEKLDYEFYMQNMSATSWDMGMDNSLVYASYIVNNNLWHKEFDFLVANVLLYCM